MIKSNWLDKQVSFYECQADNKGTPATFRDILFTNFALPHKWYWKDKQTQTWKNGMSNDLETMIQLRRLPAESEKKGLLKQTLQCYTPAALLAGKRKGEVIEISRSGIMQLDFDFKDISFFDVEELKQAVFELPFIGFCGLSCTGKGFYALALIAEAERLFDYAEHCFEVLLKYGIKADTSKGKKPENLRYVSYDANMLFRINPEPLHIKHFKPKQQVRKRIYKKASNTLKTGNSALVNSQLRIITEAVNGSRMSSVQKVAFTLGGTNDFQVLEQMKDCINQTPAFADDVESFIKCADDCFKNGTTKPFINSP